MKKQRKPKVSHIFAAGSVTTAILGAMTKNQDGLLVSLMLAGFAVFAQIGEKP